MGLHSNKVARCHLQPGDHIYCYRKLHTYSHHGIYVEEDRVIHYTRTKEASNFSNRGKQCKNCGHRLNMARGVVKTCVDCFLKGYKLYRFEYAASNMVSLLATSSSRIQELARRVILIQQRKASVVRLICSATKEEGLASTTLFENNCESFAIYCKTNKHMSGQAFAAINAAKCAVKAFVKHDVDRLLQDVKVHHPHKYEELKRTIGNLITLPYKQIVATLKKLNAQYTGDQGEDAVLKLSICNYPRSN